MAISNVASNLRPGVCTSSTRPSNPYEGQTIYETDTDRVLVWGGSSWIIITSTLGMNIDSGDRVQMSLAPSVSASRSGDLSYNNAAQNVPVVFNSTSHNIGNHYSTTTGLLTAPIAGDYMVSCGLYNAAGANTSQIWFVHNGNRGVSFVLSATTLGNMAGTSIQRLAAGDTLGVAGWYEGATVTITANGYHTFLRMRYIG